MLSTVDRNVRAGDERGLVRAEIDDETCDLLRLSQAPERNLRQDLAVENLLRNRRNHLGADVTGRDGVDRHALARDFERQCLAEAVHARLGGRIVGLPERALGAVHGRDVDDAAPAAIDHAVDDLLGHVEHRIEVRANDGVPVRLGHLLERGVARDPRIVDENIDRADLLGDPANACLARFEVGDVDRIGVELEAGGLVLGEPVLDLGVAGRMGHHHTIARGMHLAADRISQASHSAGNDRYAHRFSPFQAGFNWAGLTSRVNADQRSTVRAMPMPPPMHSVARPRPASRFVISCSSVTRMRAPDAPIGWPIAIAPPLTLTMPVSHPMSLFTAIACAAKASFASIRSRSFTLHPAFSSALRDAGIGPLPMICGSTPAVAHDAIRASGVMPRRSASDARITTTTAAPSLSPDALPAVT